MLGFVMEKWRKGRRKVPQMEIQLKLKSNIVQFIFKKKKYTIECLVEFEKPHTFANWIQNQMI